MVMVDLAGFTKAIAPRSARCSSPSSSTTFYRLMADVVESHGGRVIKFVGDGCLAVFDEDHAIAAVSCVQRGGRALRALGRAHGVALDVGANVHLSVVVEGDLGGRTTDIVGAGVVHVFRMGSRPRHPHQRARLPQAAERAARSVDEATATRDVHVAGGGVMTGELRCFLMSDLEGSNHLWATSPESMAKAVRVLDADVGAAVDEHRGTLLKARGEGDSHFAVFALASDAVTSACALQARLATPVNGLDLRARVAVHVGEVDAIDGDYYGVAVNQTARLRAIAHGGQSVVSSVATVLAAPALANRVELRSLGHHRIRDFAASKRSSRRRLQGLPPRSHHFVRRTRTGPR